MAEKGEVGLRSIDLRTSATQQRTATPASPPQSSDPTAGGPTRWCAAVPMRRRQAKRGLCAAGGRHAGIRQGGVPGTNESSRLLEGLAWVRTHPLPSLSGRRGPHQPYTIASSASSTRHRTSLYSNVNSHMDHTIVQSLVFTGGQHRGGGVGGTGLHPECGSSLGNGVTHRIDAMVDEVSPRSRWW